MQYNKKYHINRMEKYGWFVCEVRENFVFVSTNKKGFDKLSPFFIIVPKRKIVIHYGISNYIFASKHFKIINGYLKCKYKFKFEHYYCDYEILKGYLFERKPIFFEQLGKYRFKDARVK